MKLGSSFEGFSAAGAAEEGGFRIAASGKAFEILSSGLYSRKIEAVIRELGCNAVDAHLAAGKGDVPIEVTLPSEGNPVFCVRDQGPGMSKEDVLVLYSTYFASTKSSSNDFTGAFGLGSKAPFAYTDSFTVESTHDGVRRTFVAARGEDGAPSILLLNEEAAPGQSGVAVSFAVEDKDFLEFANSAHDVLQYFAVQPVVYGGSAVPPRQRKVSLDLGGGATLSFSRGETRVVMGGVAYPLSFAATMTGAYSAFGSDCLLDLPIGVVSVAASREELQYDKASVAYLREVLDKALTVVNAWLRRQLKELDEFYAGRQWDGVVARRALLAKLAVDNNARLTALLGGGFSSSHVDSLLSASMSCYVRGCGYYRFVNKERRWTRQSPDGKPLVLSTDKPLTVYVAKTLAEEARVRQMLVGRTAEEVGQVIMTRTDEDATLFLETIGASELSAVSALTLPALPVTESAPRARKKLLAKVRVVDFRALRGDRYSCSVADLRKMAHELTLEDALDVCDGVFLSSSAGGSHSTLGLKLGAGVGGTSEGFERILCLFNKRPELLSQPLPRSFMLFNQEELAKVQKIVAAENTDGELPEVVDVDTWVQRHLQVEELDKLVSGWDTLAVGHPNCRDWSCLVSACTLVPPGVVAMVRAALLKSNPAKAGELFDEALGAIGAMRDISRGSFAAETVRRLSRYYGKVPPLDLREVKLGAQYVVADGFLFSAQVNLPISVEITNPDLLRMELLTKLMRMGVSSYDLAKALGEVPEPEAAPDPAPVKAKAVRNAGKPKLRAVAPVLEGQLDLFEALREVA